MTHWPVPISDIRVPSAGYFCMYQNTAIATLWLKESARPHTPLTVDAGSMSMNRPHVQCVSTNQGKAYVIDSSISEETLQWIDNFRCSLTLNSKRPTVDRRFFADGLETTLLGKQDDSTALSSSTSHLDSERPMARLLESAIEDSICSI